MKTIDIVVPCYNEEASIRPFYTEIDGILKDMQDYFWRIIFIDDGSIDGTMKEIKELENSAGSDRIKYISFSRNFGKEAALYAGLSACDADYCVVMDADLQHPPEMIPKMLKVIDEEDYDCVGARRISRKGEPVIRSAFSRGFYHVINWVTGLNLVSGMTDFRVMKRKVVNAIVSMGESERFIKGIYSWVGFKTKWLEYTNVERAYGTSKWSFKGLWNYAKSGFIAFAVTPLRGVVYLGMLAVLAAVIYAVKVWHDLSIQTRHWEDTTTIIILMLFFGGVIITVLGIIGEYIARIYLEVKHRPIYIERETNLHELSPDNAVH